MYAGNDVPRELAMPLELPVTNWTCHDINDKIPGKDEEYARFGTQHQLCIHVVHNRIALDKELFCLFVCFVALRPKSTAMVMWGRSVHLTTLFPRQS